MTVNNNDNANGMNGGGELVSYVNQSLPVGLTVIVNVRPLVTYSKSHFKSVTFALHVFRSLLKQFSSDFHEIWQMLVSSLTAPALKISGRNIMWFKS